MGQRSFDGMDRGAGAAQCKPLKKAPKKLIEWPSRTTRSIKIDWVICALHPFLEHFSVDLPKERARRQYAQYGEREATQGKSLKNALNQHRAQTGRCIPLHPLLRHKMTDESLTDALFGRHYAKEARALRVFNQNRWKVFNFQCFDPVCMRFNIDPHKAYSRIQTGKRIKGCSVGAAGIAPRSA